MQPDFPQKPDNSTRDTETTPQPFTPTDQPIVETAEDTTPSVFSSTPVAGPAASSTESTEQTMAQESTFTTFPTSEVTEGQTSIPSNDDTSATTTFGSTADMNSPSGIPASGAFGSVAPLGVPAGVAVAGKSRFNKKLVAIIAAVATVILAGSAALAYVVISNTPAMILRDAFYNTSSKTEGNFDVLFETYTNGQNVKATATGAYQKNAIRSDFTVESDKQPNKKLAFHAYAVDKKFYFKMDDVRKNIAEIGAQVGPEYGQFIAPFDNLINMVDGKWILTTEDDFEKYFGMDFSDDGVSVCIENALTKYQSEKKQQQEVLAVYEKNQFLVVEKMADEKVGDRSAYHFSVAIDEQKEESFGEAIKSTTIYKAVNDCNPNGTEDNNESSVDTSSKDDPTPDMQIWIDKQSRTFRKAQIKITGEQGKKDTLAAVTFDFFSPVAMNEPKADVTIEQLKTEIDKLSQQFMVPQTAPVSAQPTLQTVLGISDIRL